MQFENQCILQRNYEPFKFLDVTGLDTITLVPKVSPICGIEQFSIFRSPGITVFAAQGIDGDRMGVPVVFFLTFFSHFSDLFLSSLLNP